MKTTGLEFTCGVALAINVSKSGSTRQKTSGGEHNNVWFLGCSSSHSSHSY